MPLQRILLLIIGAAGFGSQIYASVTGLEVNLAILGASLLLMGVMVPADILKIMGRDSQTESDGRRDDEKPRQRNKPRSDGNTFHVLMGG